MRGDRRCQLGTVFERACSALEMPPHHDVTPVRLLVPQKAEAMWRVIPSGGEIDKMLPGVIETCRVEGFGAGARRFCGTKSGPLEETILLVDDDARLFRYRIDRQTMMPLAGYEGTLHITDLGARGTEVLWFGTFELIDAKSEAAVVEGLTGMFTAAIERIGALATK